MSGRASGHEKLHQIYIMVNLCNFIPSQMPPGHTRSAVMPRDSGGSENLVRGSRIRIDLADVGMMNHGSGEVAEMACRRCLDFAIFRKQDGEGKKPEN